MWLESGVFVAGVLFKIVGVAEVTVAKVLFVVVGPHLAVLPICRGITRVSL